jgi:hypothetical protein
MMAWIAGGSCPHCSRTESKQTGAPEFAPPDPEIGEFAGKTGGCSGPALTTPALLVRHGILIPAVPTQQKPLGQ